MILINLVTGSDRAVWLYEMTAVRFSVANSINLTSLTIINFFGSNPIKNTALYRYLHKLTYRVTIKPVTYAASRPDSQCFL